MGNNKNFDFVSIVNCHISLRPLQQGLGLDLSISESVVDSDCRVVGDSNLSPASGVCGDRFPSETGLMWRMENAENSLGAGIGLAEGCWQLVRRPVNQSTWLSIKANQS